VFIEFRNWNYLNANSVCSMCESTNPKVPTTFVQIICDDEVDAHFASPKSESCVQNQQCRMRPNMCK